MPRCVIIAAGPVRDADPLGALLREDDCILAADGGLHLAERIGRVPDAIIADFDSASPDAAGNVPVQRLPVQKDWTDTMAAAMEGLKRGYREFLLLGCTGGRLDHTLANVAVLHYLLNRGAHAVLADETNRLELFTPASFTIEPQTGWKFSLLPYAGDVSGLTIRHAAYLLDNATLTMENPIGVSNEFCGKPAEITFRTGILMVLLSKD